MQNLALVSLDELKVLISEKAIPNETWNSKQAADYLEITLPTLFKEVKAGKIPGVKIASEWKFNSIALFELVARKKTYQDE
ncbi:helix-turn-helix domain-containing protein [Enterococcus sp. AZ103]|uniref:helix-turn-helix domain-containing protein n=1 Tax=Enterococcus sp. AZ103 TaxID=2774628 RepID=UPI003F1F7D29